MKFYKKEKEKFEWTEKYIIEELITDRHILACLGSAGLTFNSDIDRFKEYLKFKGNENLIKIIDNDRSLTKKEINTLKKGVKKLE